MIEVKLVKQLDVKEQLMDLFNASFNQRITQEYWDWYFLRNPLVSDDPEVIVAMDKSRIVGARPFLLAEMWLRETKVKVAQHCHTMVHPDYQRRGIFSQMGKFAGKYLEDNGYALSYGFPGPMSRSGFLKQGYKIVVEQEEMFRVVHYKNLLPHKLGNKFLGHSFGFVFDKLSNNAKNAKIFLRLCDQFKIGVFDKFTDALKDVDEIRDKSKINLVRSESYLKWRLDRHPCYKYKYIIAKKEGKLCGYAVISVRQEQRDYTRGILVDYLVDNDNIDCFRILMDSSIDELINSGADTLQSWALVEPKFQKDLLGSFGFKSLSKYPYNRFVNYEYFESMLIDKKVAEHFNIYDKYNWKVTPIYKDTI